MSFIKYRNVDWVIAKKTVAKVIADDTGEKLIDY